MPEGALGHVGFARESSWGTAVAAKHYIPILPGETIAQTKDLLVQDTIRGDWDHPQAREGVNAVSGSFAIEMDPLKSAYFLMGLFGAAPSTKNIDTFTLLSASAEATMAVEYAPPVSSRVIVTVSGGTDGTGTVKINGKDSAGEDTDETLTFSGNGTQVTTKVFSAITSVVTTDLHDEATPPTITLKSLRTVSERAEATDTLVFTTPGIASKLRITVSEGTDNTGMIAVTGTDRHGAAQDENVTISPTALLAATPALVSMSLTTQPSVASRLEFIVNGGTTGDGEITITGKDEYGNDITETLVFATNGTKTTGQHFASVSAIATTGLHEENEVPTIAVNEVTYYTENIYGSVTALTSSNLSDEIAVPKTEIDAYAYYEHTFKPATSRWSAACDVPPFTLEVWRDDTDDTPYAQQYSGIAVASGQLEFSVSTQIPKLTLNVVGKGMTQAARTTPAFGITPSYTTWDAVITIDQAANTDLEGITIGIDNHLTPRHTLSGTRDATKIVRTEKRDVTIDLSVLWNDNTEFNAFLNQTQRPFVVKFTHATAIACGHKYTMTWSVPAFKYAAFAPLMGDLGPIVAEAKGIADNDLSSGYTIQCVIENTYPDFVS